MAATATRVAAALGGLVAFLTPASHAEVTSVNWDSLVCPGRDAVCSPDLEMWRPWYPPASNAAKQHVARALKDRFDRRRAEQQQPVVLHIGPGELTESELMGILPFVGARIAFIEPYTPVLPDLQRKAEELRKVMSPSPTFEVVNAAICAEEMSEPLLYAPPNHLTEVEGITKEMLLFVPDLRIGSYASLSAERVLRTIAKLLPGNVLSRVNESEWARQAAEINNRLKTREENVKTREDSEVVGMPTRCLTPATVMAELQVRPQAIDMLKVWIEDYNVPLLASFLAIPGFRPAFIEFKWAIHHDNEPKAQQGLSGVSTALSQLGYAVHKNMESLWAIAQHGGVLPS